MTILRGKIVGTYAPGDEEQVRAILQAGAEAIEAASEAAGFGFYDITVGVYEGEAFLEAEVARSGQDRGECLFIPSQMKADE